MKNKALYTIIVLVSVLAIGCIAYAYSLTQNIEVTGDYNYYEAEGQSGDVVLGGAGQDHYFMESFHDGAMVAGATSTLIATTSSGDLLLTAKQICDNNWISLNSAIDAGAFTLTLPTAALLKSMCYNGQGLEKTGSLYVDNNSGDNVTVTAGSGGILLEGDSLNVVIATGHWAKLEIIMSRTGTEYILTSTELQDGD